MIRRDTEDSGEHGPDHVGVRHQQHMPAGMFLQQVVPAGGNTLANVLSQLKYGGAAAICGLAESMSLPTTVAPFILRGISMYGIESVMASIAKRKIAWTRLASDLDLTLLDDLSFDLDFEDLPQAAEDILDGKIRGRAVVKLP